MALRPDGVIVTPPRPARGRPPLGPPVPPDGSGLLVLGPAERRGYWRCRCECCRECEVRPGYVGMFVLDEGESKPFVATAERDGGYVVIEYTNGGGVHSILSPVRYLGRGRIEPARIVMEGEPDRIAELEAQVRMLREFARECATNFDCDRDAHRYQTFCRQCEARAALAATAPKEKRR